MTPTQPPAQASTLSQQVADAQAEMATWTPEQRASVQLQGRSNRAPVQASDEPMRAAERELVRACKAATSDAEKVAAIDAYRAALKAQPAPTEAQGDTLRNIGAQMANVMFNLKQKGGKDAAIYAKLQEKWDAAVSLQPSGNTGELVQGEDSALLDPVVEANRTLLHERSQLGIRKYGGTLDEKRYPHRELLTHALLEALDLSNYLQAAIMGIDRASAETGGVE